ncbi:CLUMA_CG019691, isoform A [Clunio marinus]|uniref:CLUMA_CG019691, isoform A n=1 Tax=Clunio marinus TaxID=568069 RepID=A0A1J1J2L2_9DIPT|nr:CLUMA_CG019691, isoform A [Clunio marinus]
MEYQHYLIPKIRKKQTKIIFSLLTQKEVEEKKRWASKKRNMQQTHPLCMYLICDFRKTDKRRKKNLQHTHTNKHTVAASTTVPTHVLGDKNNLNTVRKIIKEPQKH